MTRALIDCRPCGGAGRGRSTGTCKACRGSGTTEIDRQPPPAGFTVRADEFDKDREGCPCYEGVKVNDGVDQCTHPSRSDVETWCEANRCPLLRACEIDAARTKEST